MKNGLLFLLFFLTLVSCGSEDDICTSGEATPRIKIKFKTAESNKAKTLDTVYVSVDLGNGVKNIISRRFPTDSVLIPLRADDAAFTDIYVKVGAKADSSKIRIGYTSKTEYVSPACGIKKNYENLNFSLINPSPVLKLQQTQTQITNEDKTSLYLLF